MSREQCAFGCLAVDAVRECYSSKRCQNVRRVARETWIDSWRKRTLPEKEGRLKARLLCSTHIRTSIRADRESFDTRDDDALLC